MELSDFGEEDRVESQTERNDAGVTDGRFMMSHLLRNVVLCGFRHHGFEEFEALYSSTSSSEMAPNWRPKHRIRTRYVAIVLCLNIGVVQPDQMNISPCARMECWIDPYSMEASMAIERIRNSLLGQYKQCQPKANYELQLDPTVDELERLCNLCRFNARSDRVLFHYNGHGVPKPTDNGEIWVFNRGYAQHIPLSVSDLDSWLKSPSIYVFDCSAAGLVFNAFVELQKSNLCGSSASPMKDCILLAACQAHESLPESADFPTDLFTSCLTTPVKMALIWYCSRSLFVDNDLSLIDKIPGQLNNRKSLLGELNWIFMAVMDTIAWNVLPHDTFQRLFRQDLLVSSLFRNFLLAERIMKSANCSPVSYPSLPPTHQHHMWDAWDMVVETCLLSFVKDPEAEFEPSSFFNEQLTAFELWLDFGSQHKKPPEQLPMIPWVILSQCHQFRALVILGRFLDMGPWAVNLVLSVGSFHYVLDLLQTPSEDIRQILTLIWTKILAFDKSCQVDLVSDGRHLHFIKFLDSTDAYPDQRAMAAFVLTVIMNGHRQGQTACLNSDLINLCLRHLQDFQNGPFLRQWLCLCLGKLWEDYPDAQVKALQADALKLQALLLEPQPQVRASATFALSNLLSFEDGNAVNEEIQGNRKIEDEITIVRNILNIVSDGSPLVRLEVAIALARFAFGHKQYLKCAATALGKHSNNVPSSSPLSTSLESSCRACTGQSFCLQQDVMASSSDPSTTAAIRGSRESEDLSQNTDSEVSSDCGRNLASNKYLKSKPIDDGIYCQCVLALCSLARDPSPGISSLSKQILKLVGIDQAVSNRIWYGGANSLLVVPDSLLPASNRNDKLAESSLGFNLGSGKLPQRFGITSVSPPQQRYFISRRKVHSGSTNPQEMGLAELLSVSGEWSNILEHGLFSHSAIYKWSCIHFSRPLLTAIDDAEDILNRRKEREKIAVDCMTKWQHLSVRNLNKQIALWDTNFALGTKAVVLQSFSPVLIASDETEQIRVWNYKDDIVLNSFDNHNLSNRGVSKLCIVNEFDNSLLLIASCDGNVRIWKDYNLMGEQKLVTAFSSIQILGPGFQNVGAVMDWQQQSGYLYASGEISTIVLWDLDREQHVNSIPSSEASISTLSASQVHNAQVAAGFKDGSVRLYDIRTPETIVCQAQPHDQGEGRVVGIGFQPGWDPLKIVSASQAGDVQFLDIRKGNDPYLSRHPCKGSLTSFVVHRHAPTIASGYANRCIKVLDLNGDQLGSINGKIGSISCLDFHPYEALLAAGATDASLSIYDD